MIFDCHTHLFTIQPNARVDRDEQALMAQRMDHCGIDRAVILGPVGEFGFEPTPDQIEIANAHTTDAVINWPQRYVGFCYLNAQHDPNWIDHHMHQCLIDGPLVGVKIWVAVSARDTRYDPIMHRCAQWNLPLLFHAWHKTIHHCAEESDGWAIADLARRHPDVQIIMAHLHGVGCAGVDAIADCPNVLVDISGGQPMAGHIEHALRRIGHERIVYGSDWPVRDFAGQLGKLNGLGLSDDQYRAITSGNLLRLLGARA